MKEGKEPPSLFQKDFLFKNLDKTTNITVKNRKNSQNSKSNIFQQSKQGILVNKGDEMGRFNMGSTVVLLFEVEENFHINVKIGDRVVYGQRIGLHTEN